MKKTFITIMSLLFLTVACKKEDPEPEPDLYCYDRYGQKIIPLYKMSRNDLYRR